MILFDFDRIRLTQRWSQRRGRFALERVLELEGQVLRSELAFPRRGSAFGR
jgi:hypothetical protein